MFIAGFPLPFGLAAWLNFRGGSLAGREGRRQSEDVSWKEMVSGGPDLSGGLVRCSWNLPSDEIREGRWIFRILQNRTGEAVAWFQAIFLFGWACFFLTNEKLPYRLRSWHACNAGCFTERRDLDTTRKRVKCRRRWIPLTWNQEGKRWRIGDLPSRIAPEKLPSQEESSLPTTIFQGLC